MTASYIVLGSARSGTSIMAGLLDIPGIKMDADLSAAAWGEDHYHNDDPVNYVWNPPALEAIHRQGDLIKPDMQSFMNKYAGFEQWGFKNTATCLSIELYLPHLPNPHFVVVDRDRVIAKYYYPSIHVKYEELKLQRDGRSDEEIMSQPRTASSITVRLRKIALSDADKETLRKSLRGTNL